MKKILLTLVVIMGLAFNSATAQKETRYKDAKVESDFVTIDLVDAVSTDAGTKFKLKIQNKTGDYIIYKAEESKFVINGTEVQPKEKMLIIEPNESGSRIINIKGAYNTVKNYSFVVNGLYKVSPNGNTISAPDFKLPASQNAFTAGNFNCSMADLEKKTDKTNVKFKCVYNGDKMGFVYLSKAAVKMPDGKEYASTHTKTKPILFMRSDDDRFTLTWEKMKGGKEMDMQLVDMMIVWHDAFVEAPLQKIKGATVEMQDGTGAANTVSVSGEKSSTPAVANAPTPPQTQNSNNNSTNKETTQYRGSGDPLKGLNVDKSTTLQVGDYYALIIGVDKYSGSWQPLKNGVKDAKAVEALLKQKYKIDVFKTLYDVQATRKNIITTMEWLAANVKEKDNVLIYFSGHGEYKQQLGKGYWVPVDAQTTSTSDYISNNDIQTFLSGIKSKHTLLISDACFSGDIFRGNTIGVPFENSERYYKEVNNLASRQALTSGGIEPVMDGGKEGHSVFAYYFLKALTGNTSKFYDASQLFSTIKIPVTNNSEQSPQFQSIKNTGDEGGQFIFIKK
ncbi:MAG TPA: caspase family protein [Bacteroidia bacterium]|nr:caspase family protein [Bacteroidia bacterium]